MSSAATAHRRSLSGLDWLNFFVADVQTGFGPFIAVYLTAREWTETEIGFVLSVGTLTMLASQVPAGALVDAMARKRLAAQLAVAAITAGPHHAYPVLDATRRPVGLVTRDDALRWTIETRADDAADETLAERVSDAGIALVHPGDVVSHALDVMLSAGHLGSPSKTNSANCSGRSRRTQPWLSARAFWAKSERAGVSCM